MKKVEVLSIGTELLMGQIANTNAQYISKRMPEIGMGVFYHSVVGDNPERLKDALSISLSRSDVVITTGGLGPTQDDLTKETIADYFGLKMVLDKKSEEAIREYFKKTGKTMSGNNLRQAYFPENSVILENDWGTAPACLLMHSGKIVIMLPGPPRELIPIFDKYVLPALQNISEKPLKSRFLRVIGVGESLVEEKLFDLVDNQTNPTIATYAKDGIVSIRITAHQEDAITADSLLDEIQEKIVDILGENIYSDCDEEIESTVVELLKNNNLMFSCVESCTGGLLAEKITSVPGASKVFTGGCVTYTNQAKINFVNVSQETLSMYSAVSKQTAMEMVEGIQSISGADVAVSITGYAGPKSEESDEPVGLVYIGIITPKKKDVFEYHFNGNRDRIRTLTVVKALDLIRRNI